MLERLSSGEGKELARVREVYLFGSYARGAPNVSDIDLAVDYDVDDAWIARAIQMSAYGRDPNTRLRRELVGSQKIFQIHFRAKEEIAGELGPLALLWERGDRLENALDRLHAIQLDETAGRAPRDPVVPVLEGLDRWVPRPGRTALSEAVSEGVIRVERLELEDDFPANSETRFDIEYRWGEQNPRRRAALAAAAYLEKLGVQPLVDGRLGELNGRRVYLDLGGGGLLDAVQWLREAPSATAFWLQVINPSSRRAQLIALLMRPGRAHESIASHRTRR